MGVQTLACFDGPAATLWTTSSIFACPLPFYRRRSGTTCSSCPSWPLTVSELFSLTAGGAGHRALPPDAPLIHWSLSLPVQTACAFMPTALLPTFLPASMFLCAHRQAHRANRIPPPGRPRERAAAGGPAGPACSCGREAGRTLAGVTGQQATIKTPPHALNLPVRRAQQCTLAACHGVCPALSSFCDSAKPSGPATCSLPAGPAQ